MENDLILASASPIRAQMLRAAGLSIAIDSPRVDETTIKHALLAEEATPHDIADALAEAKARKIANRHAGARVLAADQVLAQGTDLFSKPETRTEAHDQLLRLRGKTHVLLSAAVLYENAEPVWRHVGRARLTMRAFSDAFLEDYLDRNWPEVGNSVGAYKLEEEGIRLFSHIEGNHFTILGLPLLELLNFLSVRGTIAA